MQKIIFSLFLSFIVQAQEIPRRPVALFLDCNIGTHYSNSIIPTMKKRGEELIVVKCKDFEAKMTELSKKNVYVKTLFASGHDGDGKIYGDNYVEDRISFDPLFDIAAVNQKYPQLFSKTQSYYPLGCYTSAPANLQQYVYVMPSLKFVSGFFGAAHSANRPVAQDYLNEVLNREDEIINAGTAAEFKQVTSRLKSMNSAVNLGMYRNLACKTQSDDYTDQALKGWSLTVDHADNVNQVVNFSNEECLQKKPEFDKNLEIYREYNSGNLEIPKDTNQGPLRKLYSFFRQNEYCKYVIKDGTFKHYPYGDTVFSLLFHRQYRENFAIWAEQDLKGLIKDLASELNQNFTPIVSSKLREVLSLVKAIKEEDMKTWSLKRINQVSRDLAGLDAQIHQLSADKKIALKNSKIRDDLSKLSKNFTQLVVERQAPSSWHEINQNYLPEDP